MSSPANLRAIGNVFLVTATNAGGLLLTLGLVALQAAAFGTSAAADAFYLARQTLASAASLIEGWLTKVFVPVFLRDRDTGEAALARRLARLALVLTLGSAAGAALLALFAPAIVAALAPGFDPDRAATAATVFRVLVIGLPLTVVAGLFSALRFSRRSFGLASLAKLLPRVAGLMGFAFAGLGLGVVGLAWWLVGGMAAMAGILVWRSMKLLARRGTAAEAAPRADATARSGDTRRAGAVTTIFAGQMALGWVNAILASLGPAGTMALMFLGLRLLNAAPGMTNTAVSTVYYTEYAAAARGARTEQARQIGGAVRLSLFFVLPLSGLLLVAAEPLVRFLLERGAFEAADTAAVALFVTAMVPSLALNALNGAFTAALLADSELPQLRLSLAASAGAVALRVAAGLALVPALGLMGLAIAILASSALYDGLIYVALRRRYGRLLAGRDWQGLARITAATAIAAVVPLAWPAGPVLLVVALFGLAFLAACLALGVTEAQVLTRKLPFPGRPSRA